MVARCDVRQRCADTSRYASRYDASQTAYTSSLSNAHGKKIKADTNADAGGCLTV
jgi:hypothetical protein